MQNLIVIEEELVLQLKVGTDEEERALYTDRMEVGVEPGGGFGAVDADDADLQQLGRVSDV